MHHMILYIRLLNYLVLLEPICQFLVNLHMLLVCLRQSRGCFPICILQCYVFFCILLKLVLIFPSIILHLIDNLKIVPKVLVYLHHIGLLLLVDQYHFLMIYAFVFLVHQQSIHVLKLLCMEHLQLLLLMLIMMIGTILCIGQHLLSINLLLVILFEQDNFDVLNQNQTIHPLCLILL